MMIKFWHIIYKGMLPTSRYDPVYMQQAWYRCLAWASLRKWMGRSRITRAACSGYVQLNFCLGKHRCSLGRSRITRASCSGYVQLNFLLGQTLKMQFGPIPNHSYLVFGIYATKFLLGQTLKMQFGPIPNHSCLVFGICATKFLLGQKSSCTKKAPVSGGSL